MAIGAGSATTAEMTTPTANTSAATGRVIVGCARQQLGTHAAQDRRDPMSPSLPHRHILADQGLPRRPMPVRAPLPGTAPEEIPTPNLLISSTNSLRRSESINVLRPNASHAGQCIAVSFNAPQYVDLCIRKVAARRNRGRVPSRHRAAMPLNRECPRRGRVTARGYALLTRSRDA